MATRPRLAGPLVAVAGAGACAAAGLVTFLAGQVVDVRRAPRFPSRLLEVGPDSVTLKRDRGTQRVGTYGLAFPGGHAVVGEVVGGTSTTVVRPVVRVDYGRLEAGPAALDHVDVGDPGTSFGLDFAEQRLTSDVGEIPAWVVPGAGSRWVVVVHGYGGKRASSLSFLPMLHELGLTAIVPSYRNDPDAPPSPDRRHHLGATEWRDVDAAVGYALDHGATEVVLFGWSMGGAIVLQTWARSAHRSAISALVLDSPVVDWRSVLLHLGRRRHVPDVAVRAAMRVVEWRVGVDFDDLDWCARASELAVPVLAVHGDDDQTVPVEPTVALAERRPDLVTLRVVEGAGHVGSWNVDPPAYARAFAAFLEQPRVRTSDEGPGPVGAVHCP